MSDHLHHPPVEELELAAVLHALSDPVRLQIVRDLAGSGACNCGAFSVPVAKSTLSHHLKVLREAGVTLTEPSGTQRVVSLRSADLGARFPGLLDAVLAAAPAAAAEDRARTRSPLRRARTGCARACGTRRARRRP
jgi:DNA-binding transcriptional ArsR family regulator